MSEDQIMHLREEWRAYALEHGQDMARFERIHTAKPHTILTMLSTIKEQYGDVQNYLMQCGVSQSQIERLQARFVG